MNTKNFLTSKEMGYRPVPPADVKDRVTRFVKRTRNTTPQKLKEPWKGCVCYTLIQYFGWEIKDVAEFLEYHRQTAQKDWLEAKKAYQLTAFLSKNTYNGAKFIYDLRDYIYYNIHRR